MKIRNCILLLKPDLVERPATVDVLLEELRQFIQSLALPSRVSLELITSEFDEQVLTDALVDGLYREHRDKDHYPALKKYMRSGPVHPYVLRFRNFPDELAEHALSEIRKEIIHLREKYAIDFRRNSIHCSDSIKAGAREYALFDNTFPVGSLLDSDAIMVSHLTSTKVKGQLVVLMRDTIGKMASITGGLDISIRKPTPVCVIKDPKPHSHGTVSQLAATLDVSVSKVRKWKREGILDTKIAERKAKVD